MGWHKFLAQSLLVFHTLTQVKAKPFPSWGPFSWGLHFLTQHRLRFRLHNPSCSLHSEGNFKLPIALFLFFFYVFLFFLRVQFEFYVGWLHSRFLETTTVMFWTVARNHIDCQLYVYMSSAGLKARRNWRQLSKQKSVLLPYRNGKCHSVSGIMLIIWSCLGQRRRQDLISSHCRKDDVVGCQLWELFFM